MDEENEMPVWEWVMALGAPFLLYPVELLLPYPYVLEELVKLVLVGRMRDHPSGWMMAGLTGFLFAVSETMLYVVNAIIAADLGVLGMRMILTTPMHVLTTLVIFGGVRLGRLGAVVGLLIGMAAHWGFNVAVGKI